MIWEEEGGVWLMMCRGGWKKCAEWSMNPAKLTCKPQPRHGFRNGCARRKVARVA